MAESTRIENLPEGMFSLLDTDLYKLTMQCAILKYMPDVQVTYAFTNRTPDMRFSRAAYHWLQEQIDKLAHITLTPEEVSFLRDACPYFSDTYLHFLSEFRLDPSTQIKVTWTPVNNEDDAQELGAIHIDIRGLWVETILYEIPLLALTSEAYFRFCNNDWDHEGQEEKAYEKGMTLLEHGCNFSEFGTRRRRDYHTHELVMQGLLRAAGDGKAKSFPGKLTGTSNVHFAMKHGVPPVGTVAHEWFMGIAAATNDYEHANETGLRYWAGCFGEGVLAIALTDTFGTPAFLKAFRNSLPATSEAEKNSETTLAPEAPRPAVSPQEGVVDVDPAEIAELGAKGSKTKPRSYAETFTGVRQDSGDPLLFIKQMRDFYDSEGIQGKKTIVFSDSLNIDRCLEYKEATEKAGLVPTFGVGTFLTNDFTHLTTGKKSAPLNIVIKLSSAAGRPAVKISDNIGKNTGDSETVRKVKERLGYVEQPWVNGDEKSRWGEEGQNVAVAKA